MATFRFSKEVSPEFLQAAQGLAALPNESVNDLAVAVIAWQTHTGRIDLAADIALLAERLSLSEAEVRTNTTVLRAFFRGAMRAHLSPGTWRVSLLRMTPALTPALAHCVRVSVRTAHVAEDLGRLGMQSDIAEAVSVLWRTHFVDLSRAVAARTVGVNELVDMDWKFGVTASSSELQKVGTSFLQLKVVINKGDHDEVVVMGTLLKMPDASCAQQAVGSCH